VSCRKFTLKVSRRMEQINPDDHGSKSKAGFLVLPATLGGVFVMRRLAFALLLLSLEVGRAYSSSNTGVGVEENASLVSGVVLPNQSASGVANASNCQNRIPPIIFRGLSHMHSWNTSGAVSRTRKCASGGPSTQANP
jgi:hypothetical protein